jgi:cytochrome P450
MRALTFEVIVRAVFGVAERDRIETLRRALVSLLDMGPIFLLPNSLRRDLGPWTPWGRFQRRLRAADALLYEEIARRRGEADLDERTDVLSLLLRARDEDGRPMTDVELRDELMTMLLAGHETTATGLAFAFDLLPRNPGVLSRLRDELDDGDDAYLDATVTETLRIRPVLDAAERTLTAPREIAGWMLPAGIRVYPAIAIVHHRPDLYPEPDQFRPERFLDGQAESYTWLPFGGGIRRCIGAALAQVEMAEVIRTVVSRVDFQPSRAGSDARNHPRPAARDAGDRRARRPAGGWLRFEGGEGPGAGRVRVGPSARISDDGLGGAVDQRVTRSGIALKESGRCPRAAAEVRWYRLQPCAKPARER